MGAEATNRLNEVLGLSRAAESELALEVSEICGGFPTLNSTALDDVSNTVLVHFLQFLRAANVELTETLMENFELVVCMLGCSELIGKLFLVRNVNEKRTH